MHGKFTILISIAAGALMASLVTSIFDGNFLKRNERWEILGWFVFSHGFLVLCAYAMRERQRRGVDDAKLWFVTVVISYIVGVVGFHIL